jgi:hypothetical protein
MDKKRETLRRVFGLQPVLIAGALGLFALKAQAQPNWAVYGTQFGSGTNLRIISVKTPNLATASTSIALDVAGFTRSAGNIIGGPTGTAIAGTSLNAAAWDQGNQRLYFRDSQGQGNLYYWQRGATIINYVASAATIMPSAASLMGDSATIYNGGYWYMEGAADTLYRYDLTAGTIRRFTGISGAAARTYDYGDIAVSATGTLYINALKTASGNMGLDKVDISSITASGGSPSSFAAIIDYGANYSATTQQIAFDSTGTKLYAVQSVSATGSGFAERTWHEINLVTGSQSATIWTSTQNFSDLGSGFAIPEPGTLALLLMGGLIPLGAVVRRTRPQ